MGLGDLVPAFKGELLVMFIAATFAIAGIGTRLSPSMRSMYKRIKLPRWAPPSWVYGFVWTVLFTLSGIAAYLVRTADVTGGPWVDTNVRALVLYFVLQAVLALYTIVASRKWHWWGAIVVLASFILCIIVVVKFAEHTTTGAIFMGVVAAWLFFALVLQAVIASRNSDGMVRKVVKGQSSAQNQKSERASRMQNKQQT